MICLLLRLLKSRFWKINSPSTFSCKWPSSVDGRFAVRPFIFILQLLLDERIKKYLNEKDEIAKVVIEHGISNEQTCVDNVVSRILEYRRIGDESLEDDFIYLYKPPRTKKEINMTNVVAGLGILLILAVTGWNIPSLLNGKTVTGLLLLVWRKKLENW